MPKRNYNAMGVQRAVSCGFNAGFARFQNKRECKPNVLRSGAVHEYPLVCPIPKIITIDRVVSIAGVDNALFLVGDVEGYRMNRNYQVEIPSDAINIVSGNFPSYLLLKNGNLHTLGFSTANIEAVIRQNGHMFSRDGLVRMYADMLPELAPQDQAVEGFDGDGCKPKRFFEHRVISNTTLNDVSVTIEILVFECNEIVDREIWHIVPVRCENVNTVKGMNWAAWDDSPKTCGNVVFIPGRSTDNGQFVLASLPTCGCPDGRGYGMGYVNGMGHANGMNYTW
jgi:hypothetical protein